VLLCCCRSAVAGFADASSADISAAADSFILPAELDARTSSSLGIAAAAGGNELQAAVAEAAMQLVLDRGAAAAAMLRGLLHTADLITVAAGTGGRLLFITYNHMCIIFHCVNMNASRLLHTADLVIVAAGKGGWLPRNRL
jgi:hypothetical protein